MDNNKTLKHGYILILSLMIISLCVALLTSIVQQALNYQRQVTFAVDREKARTLALGSIELAISQISQIVQEEKKEEAKTSKEKPTEEKNQTKDVGKKEEKQTPEQKWLSKLLKVINKEQSIELKEQTDGIDATIKIYIAGETGKINLNELVKQIQVEEKNQTEAKKGVGNAMETSSNNKNQKEKNGPQKKEEFKLSTVLNELFQKNIDANIINAIKETQKRVGRAIDDPTELLKSPIGKLKQNVFITLPAGKIDLIYLMDLFTISESSGKLNPWLFSRSLAKLLGLSIKEDKEKIEELVKKFKPSINWSSDWDKILASTYGKKFNALPKITSMFGTQFEATAFSIVSYVKVGSAIQRLYAILEKDTTPEGLSPKSMVFKIAKIYWL